ALWRAHGQRADDTVGSVEADHVALVIHSGDANRLPRLCADDSGRPTLSRAADRRVDDRRLRFARAVTTPAQLRGEPIVVARNDAVAGLDLSEILHGRIDAKPDRIAVRAAQDD